jgi:hypothetical protein
VPPLTVSFDKILKKVGTDPPEASVTSPLATVKLKELSVEAEGFVTL